MPVPVLAILAAGGVAALSVGRRGDASSGADGADPQEETEAPSPTPTGAWSARVEWWRQYLEPAAGSIPVDFILRWIQRESDGDPASVGTSREVGIGQVYYDTGVTTLYGHSLDELHVSTHTPSSLSEAQRTAQVESMVGLATTAIERAGAALSTLGISWSAPDILALAKLWHNLPVLVSTYLPAASQSDMASSWDAFRAWARALSLTDAVSVWSGARSYWGSGGKPGFERFFDGAQYVGRGGSAYGAAGATD